MSFRPDPKPVKKQKSKKRYINAIAPKKASDVAKYNRDVKVWKSGRLCVCGCKRQCDHNHHMRGREGYADMNKYWQGITLLHDKDFWLPVCFDIHRKIHDNHDWALDMGYSLSKAKNIYR